MTIFPIISPTLTVHAFEIFSPLYHQYTEAGSRRRFGTENVEITVAYTKSTIQRTFVHGTQVPHSFPDIWIITLSIQVGPFPTVPYEIEIRIVEALHGLCDVKVDSAGRGVPVVEALGKEIAKEIGSMAKKWEIQPLGQPAAPDEDASPGGIQPPAEDPIWLPNGKPGEPEQFKALVDAGAINLDTTEGAQEFFKYCDAYIAENGNSALNITDFAGMFTSRGEQLNYDALYYRAYRARPRKSKKKR